MEYHVIKNIEKHPEQWWPCETELLVRGTREDAEKEARERKYESYSIEKWEPSKNDH